jgi:hypothetical protein
MRNQLRLLQVYTAVSTTALFVLTLSAFDRSSSGRAEREITAERINIVDSTGRVRLQIAGSFPPRRTELAGILFVNNDGGEAGGLVYRGAKRNGKVSAGGTLTMDQYNEDQVVALQYNQDGGRKTSGLTIGERPDTMGKELSELYRALDPMPESPRRDSIARTLIAALPANQRAARRVFVGRDTAKAAILNLSDRSGVTRLQLKVDSLGRASISFLDAGGRVVRTIADSLSMR